MKFSSSSSFFLEVLTVQILKCYERNVEALKSQESSCFSTMFLDVESKNSCSNLRKMQDFFCAFALAFHWKWTL